MDRALSMLEPEYLAVDGLEATLLGEPAGDRPEAPGPGPL